MYSVSKHLEIDYFLRYTKGVTDVCRFNYPQPPMKDGEDIIFDQLFLV